ncbi:MAG: hypothetical protein FJW90_07665, partial [Actinobacteria bacterium]|nr:hypothetical protein [Actinomycetota bacterium]
MRDGKLQQFGSDLLYDLRSRGLLPLVVGLAVAIVAAPLVIKMMSGSEEAPAGGQSGAVTIEPAPDGQAAVLAYSPGLRKYQQRLDGSSSDPFRQQFPAIAADTLGGSGAGVASSDGKRGGSGGSGGGSGGGGSGGGSG